MQVADLAADAAKAVVRCLLPCLRCAARTRWTRRECSCGRRLQGGPGLQAHAICEAGGEAQAVVVDVCDYQQQREMFQAHLKAFGKLDYAVLNAGIGEQGACAGSMASPLPCLRHTRSSRRACCSCQERRAMMNLSLGTACRQLAWPPWLLHSLAGCMCSGLASPAGTWLEARPSALPRHAHMHGCAAARAVPQDPDAAEVHQAEDQQPRLSLQSCCIRAAAAACSACADGAATVLQVACSASTTRPGRRRCRWTSGRWLWAASRPPPACGATAPKVLAWHQLGMQCCTPRLAGLGCTRARL